jgi:hypothetical protein
LLVNQTGAATLAALGLPPALEGHASESLCQLLPIGGAFMPGNFTKAMLLVHGGGKWSNSKNGTRSANTVFNLFMHTFCCILVYIYFFSHFSHIYSLFNFINFILHFILFLSSFHMHLFTYLFSLRMIFDWFKV